MTHIISKSLTRLKYITSKYSWHLIACLALMVIVMGFWGFREIYPDRNSYPATRILYLTLQLFTMKSGDVVPMNLYLEFARWGGAMVVFGAILKTLATSLKQQIDASFLKRVRNHTIVIGAGEIADHIANHFLENRQTVVRVFPSESGSAKPIESRPNLFEMKAQPYTKDLLQRISLLRAKVVFVVHQCDEQNFRSLMEIAPGMQEHLRSNTTPPACCVYIDSPETVNPLIDAMNLKKLNISFFNHRENSARHFLKHTNLDAFVLKNKSPEIFVVGHSLIRKPMVLQIARSFLSPDETRIKMTFISPDANNFCSGLAEEFPQLEKLIELNPVQEQFQNQAVLRLLENGKDKCIAPILILDDNQLEGMSLANKILETGLVSAYQICIYQPNGETFENSRQFLPSDGDVPEILGDFKTVCDGDAIYNNTIDQTAKVVHQTYLDSQLRNGVKINSKPSIRDWNDLNSFFREANRRQADHFYAKLRMAGLMLVETDESHSEPFEFEMEEIELLARIEHRRWAAELYLDGWKYGETRNDLKKLHPNLVPWEQLTEAIKDYDRQPVKQIPSILAQMNLQIQR
ncbi:RyR domain-containing protein [Mariniblastus sp.]|nr:RyR domain-containing protein [bacterium]MDB4373064.1 RyR domain-containing protein [Mariniblastus sp.]